MFLTFFFVEVILTADTVLLRHEHGGDADRHRDVISCAYDAPSADGGDGLFNAAQLLETIVVPDALWCDGELHCHDAMSGKEFRGVSLNCDKHSQKHEEGVRCILRVDCAALIRSFWHSLIATVGCILAFIIVPAVCINNRPRRVTLDYNRDVTL
jgi:hypothetical protein